MSNMRNTVILIVGFFECLLFGGTIFGWASLAYVLKQDGIYSGLCSSHINNSSDGICGVNETNEDLTNGMNGSHNDPGTVKGCVLQDEQLTMVFTVGIALFGLTSFPVGWAFDHLGLRTTRCFASVLAVAGYLMLGLAEPGIYSWLVFPGFACVSVSCTTVIVTNTYLLHDIGVERIVTLSVLASLWLPLLVYTFVLIPRHQGALAQAGTDEMQTPKEVFVVELVSYKLRTENSANKKSEDNNIKTGEERYIQYPPVGPVEKTVDRIASVKALFRLLASVHYLLYIYWYVALHVRIQMFISNFGPWVTYIVHDDNVKVSHFTNVLGYVQMCSIIISPIAGALMDMRRRTQEGQAAPSAGRAVVALPSIVICNVTALLLNILVLRTPEPLVYAIIIVSEIFRSFFYSTSLALLELTYPSEHYGGLFGFARTVGGVASFVQYPYTLWANASPHHFLPVDIFILCSVLATLGLPIYITWKAMKSWDVAKKVKQAAFAGPPEQRTGAD